MLLLTLLFVASTCATSAPPPDAKEFLNQLEMTVKREVYERKSMRDLGMTLHNYTDALLATLRSKNVPPLALSVVADIMDLGTPRQTSSTGLATPCFTRTG